MATYVLPTNQELQLVMQEKIPVLTMDDPIFSDIMPIRNSKYHLVSWEQRDNYKGLTTVRGLDGQPGRVSRVGLNQYQMEPGVYGDFMPLTETDLTVQREPGTYGDAINVSSAIGRDQEHLLNRAVDRLRQIGWTLVTTGTFSIPGPDGTVKHTDTFTLQTFTASVTWSTHGSSTPLADMRNMKLKARGKGVRFGRGAKLYMNAQWVNHMLDNTNPNDLGGKRAVDTNGQPVALSLDKVNEILTSMDLPNVVEYDEGYLAEDGTVAGTFTLFIADAKAVLIGQRKDGSPVAEFIMTRNPNNDGAEGGMYNKVKYREDEVPVNIETHIGFNGGIALYFPSSIVRATL